MKELKEEQVEFTKNVFKELNIIFTELPNGQFKIDETNYWATSENWFDPTTFTKGKGIYNFIQHLNSNNFLMKL